MVKVKVVFRILLGCFSFLFVLFLLMAGMGSASQMFLSAMKHGEIVGFIGTWLILNMLFYLFLRLAFQILSEKPRQILMATTILFLIISGLLLMMASVQLRNEIGYNSGFILWLLAILAPVAEAAAQEDEFTLFPV